MGKDTINSPLQDASGKVNEQPWLVLPQKVATGTSPSGLYVVPTTNDAALELGLGLLHELTTADDAATITPFALLPLVQLPFADQSPLVLGQAGYPVPVGLMGRLNEQSITHEGVDYAGFKIIVNFDLVQPAQSTVMVLLAHTNEAFQPVSFTTEELPTFANDLLQLAVLQHWLRQPILDNNPNTTSPGDVLTQFGLLQEDEAGVYQVRDLATIRQLTFTQLAYHTLHLLRGLQLIQAGTDGQEGLFIVGTPNEATQRIDYGLRYVLTDVALSEGTEDEEEKTQGQTFLQLGKGFAPTANEADGDWTNSSAPPGINLYLLNSSTAAQDLRLRPHLELVSIGLDYRGVDDQAVISSGGFSLTGIEPRMFLSLDDQRQPGILFGAATRVDQITLPIDAGLTSGANDSNPVVSNLLSADGQSAESAPGEKSTPPAQTKFSFSAAYTPIAEETQAQHHFNATLYDQDNEPTERPIWWKLQRSFGPLALDKIGLAWNNTPRELSFYLDGGLQLSGLTVGLESLSLTLPLTDLSHPQLDLQGLSLTYTGGDLTVSGGFLKVENDDGIAYNGEALIQMESFGLSALGSYSTVNDHPSLFIFALLNAPLGGPSFFFVTGVAAGFGYNRDLKLPEVKKVTSFPLVAAVTASETGDNPLAGADNDLGKALQVMEEYIPPKYGADWLAAGIRFTSFEIIESCGLRSVQVGTRFVIGVVWTATITVPTKHP
ncbi:MAG: DUF6603 domain-containing protein, partial [Bacteroidota bacterium]